MPKFSVVIPTRARPDTLAHTLRTAVEQTYQDVEILVHESGDDPRVAETVAQGGDHRTRFVKTGVPVSMPENWERALSCATGEFITFIGDDDALVSDACASVAGILEKTSAEAVSWPPASYFWPSHLIDSLRNRLQALITEPDVVELKSSRVMLELAYHFRADYSRLPMIYHSFISRALIDRIRAKIGRYFLAGSPDVSSGIVNAFFSDVFLYTRRPLSVAGYSHHSTGHRLHSGGDAGLRETAAIAAGLELPAHPTLIPSDNFHIAIGNEMLHVKKQVFLNEPPGFNHKSLLYWALQAAPYVSDPESALADIQEVARKNGISLEDFPVVLKPSDAGPPAQGMRIIDTSSMMLDVNCERLGIADVRGAAGLLEALVPQVPQPRLIADQPALLRVPIVSVQPVEISFSHRGNGSLFLGFGWSDLESWGVWTSGHRAEVVLPLESPPDQGITITVRGHMFVHPRFPTAAGWLWSQGQRVASFSATTDQPDLDIQLELEPQAAQQEVRLEFEIECPRRPADYGISTDTRQLGFGLKQIVITV